MKYYPKNKTGFVILFGVMLVSIVLTVSLTLMNITLKQLILSSVARESKLAIFASDSGRNCARYWNSFEDDSNPFGYYTLAEGWHPPTSISFSCGNSIDNFQAADLDAIGQNGEDDSYRLTTFDVIFGDDQNPSHETCAKVEVMQRKARKETTVRSRGYNNYSSVCPANSDRTVERGTEITY